MSALQDILDKMYVDPELLEQLDEEQKQILFIKMREEQLRRWREREEKLEKAEQTGVAPPKKCNPRKIQWLTGRDGEVWVWVMGEHPNDPSIDDILEKEAKQKAREIAEKEVLFESLNMDIPLSDTTLDEQQLKKQLMDIKFDKNAHANGSPQPLQKRTSYSPYDELGTVHSSNSTNTAQSPVQQTVSRKSLPNNYAPTNLWEGEKQITESLLPNGLYSTGNSTFYKRLPSSQNSTNNRGNHHNTSLSSPNHQNASADSYKNAIGPFRELPETKQAATFSIRPPPIPEKPPGLRRSSALTGNPAQEEFVQFTRSYVPGSSPNHVSGPQSSNVKSITSNSFSSFPVSKTNNFDEGENNSEPKSSFNGGRGSNVSRLAARISADKGSRHFADEAGASPSGSPKLSRPANNTNGSEGDRNKYLPQLNKNNFFPQSTDRESGRLDGDPMLRLRSMLRTEQPQMEKTEKKEKQLDSVDASIRGSLLSEEVDKRQSRILEQIKEQRSRMELEAEAEAQKQGKEWEEQERKAREAEAQIRLIAQRAREQHRKNLRTSDSLRPILNDISGISLKEAIKNLPRPPKPQNRRAIIEWYRNVELPKGTGLDPKSGQPAVWFHGVISRSDAEELLSDRPPGSFLVRVSERIWGYTISYVVGDGTTKHFLVEKIPDGYQFLGTNQLVHSTLFELVQYHETAPITPKGKEILMKPVGQIREVPDYNDLLN